MSSDNVRFRNMLLSNTQEAIAFLYDKYLKSLFRYAYLITKDKESSERHRSGSDTVYMDVP